MLDRDQKKDEAAVTKEQMNKNLQFMMKYFSWLMNIADAIMVALFEKVSVIPYSIRQFCKVLYQKALEKFGPKKEINTEKAIALIAHFLLQNWLLKACFHDLNLEGLSKEFYLHPYCKRNLQLASLIVERILTFQDWEVPNPTSEQFPNHTTDSDLFRIPAAKKAEYKEYTQRFY